jgi:hypothetical protein
MHVDTHPSIRAWLSEMWVTLNCSKCCHRHDALRPAHGDICNHH